MANRFRLGATIASASAIALASPVLAQDAPVDEDNGDIVVTAQKREQNLLDVPLAIQAISGAQLEEQGTKGCCQSNGNSSLTRAPIPKATFS